MEEPENALSNSIREIQIEKRKWGEKKTKKDSARRRRMLRLSRKKKKKKKSRLFFCFFREKIRHHCGVVSRRMSSATNQRDGSVLFSS